MLELISFWKLLYLKYILKIPVWNDATFVPADIYVFNLKYILFQLELTQLVFVCVRMNVFWLQKYIELKVYFIQAWTDATVFLYVYECLLLLPADIHLT